MKIERVQYDGEGEWLDVHFDDGEGFRLPASWLRAVLRLAFAKGFLATYGRPERLEPKGAKP